MDPIFILTSLIAGAFPIFIREFRKIESLRPFWDKVENNPILIALLKALRIEIPKPPESYEVRMNKLIAKFNEVTVESETIISELEQNLRNKQGIVTKLEKEESALAVRIEKLRQAPEFGQIQIQQQLEKLIQEQRQEGRKSILRDYTLFAAGVLTPIIISWIARLFGYEL